MRGPRVSNRGFQRFLIVWTLRTVRFLRFHLAALRWVVRLQDRRYVALLVVYAFLGGYFGRGWREIRTAGAGGQAPVPLEAVSDDGSVEAPLPGWLPSTVMVWEDLIREKAVTYGVDPVLLAIVMLVESGGNPTICSEAGACGLMQIMPTTGQDIATRRGIADFEVSDLLNPELNVDFGAWYLAEKLRDSAIEGDADRGWLQTVAGAAVAYNAGQGHLNAVRAGEAQLYPESDRYRAWVAGMYSQGDQCRSESFQDWYEAGGFELVRKARLAAG